MNFDFVTLTKSYFSYLNGSLGKLAKKMVDDGKELSLLRSSTLCSDSRGLFSDEKYKLLIRKGVIIHSKM